MANRVEPHDQIGCFVNDPDVLIAVDAHHMTVGETVDTLADFAHVIAVFVKLQQLRRDGVVGWTGDVRVRDYK